MSNLVRNYIKKISDQEKIFILSDYEKFDHDGIIGEGHLRDHTKKMMTEMKVEDHVVMWMNFLGTECHRYFSINHLLTISNHHENHRDGDVDLMTSIHNIILKE